MKRTETSGFTICMPYLCLVGSSILLCHCDLPAAEKNVIGPYRGQGEEPVQAAAGDSWLHCGERLHVPQDELSPSKPLLIGLMIAPERIDPLGQLRVLAKVFRNNVLSTPLPRHPCNNKHRLQQQKTLLCVARWLTVSGLNLAIWAN